jgi:hypothetical protein
LIVGFKLPNLSSTSKALHNINGGCAVDALLRRLGGGCCLQLMRGSMRLLRVAVNARIDVLVAVDARIDALVSLVAVDAMGGLQ